MAADVEIEEHDDGWMVTTPDGVYAVLKDADGAVCGCSCGEYPFNCPHFEMTGHTVAFIPIIPAPTPTQSPLHPSTPTPPTTRTLASLAIDGQPDLPSWLTGLHPHQWDAVEEVVEHYAAGAKVVFVDAPTGSGKTLIGEATRRVLSRSGHASKALYVCSDRALQDQFLADYEYAKVLKGRANYPTQDGGGQVDCSDCTKNAGDADCMWCHNPGQCPYLVAKMGAIKSPLAVLNTAYLLAEANSAGVFSERAFSILDECDVLEQVLMGYVEFRVGDKVLKKLRLSAPKKGSHYPTIINWIREELRPKVMVLIGELTGTRTLWGADVSKQREINGLKRLAGSIETILALGSEGDNWVRDNDAGPLVLKPIKVDLYGDEVLWSHADKWLCMSATIISPDQMADSLGIEDGTWETVQVPMTFPVENRPIYQIPVASMTYKEKETAEPLMAQGVLDVVNMHPGERVLVHAVSYHLAEVLTQALTFTNRKIVTYRSAQDKDRALREYRATPGAVLVASSMDRGVDLKDDDCRVVIIAKIPYPSLKDPQVSKRMHMPGGEEWYAVQTVRSIVQMTGRGVRSKEDWAKTYILDSQFGINVFKRNKMLFPKWWRDAVRFVPYHHLQEGRVI